MLPDMPPNPPTEPIRRRITLTDDGPILVHGPVEVVLTDGKKVISDRAVTALCTCLRSSRYPICDTSHRRRVRNGTARGSSSGLDLRGRGC
jgi:CDGSH-type Zn-finger protein